MAGIGIAKRGLGLLAKGGRAGFKRGKAVTKADLAKRDLWTKRELKRRSKIGQRKSKWDIKGAISGHPLNPFRIHAAGKATDWTKRYKDTYGRTRDELKKSQDPNVKKVAEGFQEMDYKDKARSHPYYKKGTKYYEEHSPKLTKRTHVGRKTGGRIGFKHAGPVSPINIPWPKPGEVPSKKRKGKAKGGRIGFRQGGAYGPLRGTTAGGVAKAFRGEAGFKQSQKLQKKLLGTKDTGLHKGSVRKATSPKVTGTQRPKTKSDFRLKHQVKQIQKSPDKKFKYNNPGTRRHTNPRTGRTYDVQKTDPVKGSIGKQKYIQDWKRSHHASQPRKKAAGGRIGFRQGSAYLPLRGTGGAGVAKAFRGEQGFKQSQALQSRIVKGNPVRQDQAQRLRAHRLRTKIKGARAGRAKQAQQEAGTAKLYAKHPGAKKLFAKQKFAKQFKRAGIR